LLLCTSQLQMGLFYWTNSHCVAVSVWATPGNLTANHKITKENWIKSTFFKDNKPTLTFK